MSAMLEI